MSAKQNPQNPPQRYALRTSDLAQIALCAVLLTVCAWIAIPFPIPFTLQTLALFLTLCTLGGRKGLYAVAVYLLLGLAGLPVFSGFQGGAGVLLGAAGGYLIGFAAAAGVYWLVTANAKSTLPAQAAACALGLAACYLLGTLWFLLFYTRTTEATTLAAAMQVCILPFLLPDLVKMGLALALSRRLRPYLT
ncbi:MAG: biotin transporter BioY [Ruminococcaceae bacterium]|nr:biotin transporter BioY [Oscillospiraceae bacterium]